jgi:hypothetical protein
VSLVVREVRMVGDRSSRRTLWPTQPPILWVPGGLYRMVKRPGREADNSHPSSAEVRKGVLYLHTPICLHGIMLK